METKIIEKFLDNFISCEMKLRKLFGFKKPAEIQPDQWKLIKQVEKRFKSLELIL